MIVGTGFSGSTLLSLLLNAHPEMVSVGEATGPYVLAADRKQYTCSCGEPLARCPFWRRVGEAMARRGVQFDPDQWRTAFRLVDQRLGNLLLTRSLRNNRLDDLRDALVLRLPRLGRAMREIAARNEALVASMCEVAGKGVFVDASKDPLRAWHLERLTDLQPHALHLVRDSLGFVSSHVHNKQSTLDLGIRNWKRMAGHVERLFQRLPAERTCRVRYEDLCTDPTATLARIAEFVGAKPATEPLAFHAGEHHVIGNKMRFATSSEIRLDERWRERFSPAQADEVRRRTAGWRRIYGYDA
jgi:hypothetical protein